MDFLPGLKTYLAAAGFLGLALYHVSQGQYEQAVQAFLAALTAVGLRLATAKVETQAVAIAAIASGRTVVQEEKRIETKQNP